MDRLERRISAYYATAIAVALIAVTFVLALALYTGEIRQVDAAASDALGVYVARLHTIGPIATQSQVAELVANTSHPGWILTVAGDSTRYFVHWPSASITSQPRAALSPTPFPLNVLDALGLIAGAHIPPKAIVAGTELVLSPTSAVESIAAETFGVALAVVLIDLVLALSAARILARRAVAPLRSLHEALALMAESGVQSASQVWERPTGDLAGLIGTYNRAIDALTTAVAQRDAAEARTRQFIADAGHQLRTPLTVINGFVGILLSGRLREADDGPKILRKISAQIAVMRDLVERLMVLEGWQTDEVAACELTDISEFVTSVVDPIAAVNSERQIRINAATGVFVRINTSELTYALSNLVSNAIKYAPDGQIDVDVTEDEKNVYISVADEGKGIPPEDLPHIFERFYRGNRREVPGSGLGLAIAKIAVERAGGTLSATNRTDKGALFTIALPRVVASGDRSAERQNAETTAAKR